MRDKFLCLYVISLMLCSFIVFADENTLWISIENDDYDEINDFIANYKKIVVIIDDVKLNHVLLNRYLMKEDYAAINFDGSVSFMNFLNKSSFLEHEHILAVVVDQNMPKQNGIDLMKELEKKNLFYKSKIVFIFNTDEDKSMFLEKELNLFSQVLTRKNDWEGIKKALNTALLKDSYSVNN